MPPLDCPYELINKSRMYPSFQFRQDLRMQNLVSPVNLAIVPERRTLKQSGRFWCCGPDT